MTVVLGLDLALKATGWALVDYDDGTLIGHGTIDTAPAMELSERLDHIATAIFDLVDTWSPIEIGVEQPIAYRSGTTTLRLGMVHGAVRVAMWRRNIAPAEYGPSAVKRHATGRGDADKTAMVTRACVRWGVDLTHDEADAAWVADLARIDSIETFGGYA